MSSESWFEHFLAMEDLSAPYPLAFLDRGAPPHVREPAPPAHPSRPEGGAPDPETSIVAPPFPPLGAPPDIDPHGLDFLHSDVCAACVVLGGVAADGTLRARWLGRNPTDALEMWSATKVIPMLRATALAGAVSPGGIQDVAIRDPAGSRPAQSLEEVFRDVVTYRGGDDDSNAQARMLKSFDAPEVLEAWVRGITGHSALRFRGGYGPPPSIAAPVMVDRPSGVALLASEGFSHQGDNAVSACDLARILGMIGWHALLPREARLPGIRSRDLDAVIHALAEDTARYLDVALEALGVPPPRPGIRVISKMGFGESRVRDATEAVYAAFLRCSRPAAPPVALALALKVARPSREALAPQVVDARMAATVTEILERFLP